MMDGAEPAMEAATTMKKEDMLREMQASRAEVMAIIHRLPDEALTTGENADGWTVKDILAHLARWEGELVTLLWQLEQGQKPTCLLVQEPLPVDDTNQEWHDADRDRPLQHILDDLAAVRRQTEKRLAAFSDEDLERDDLAAELDLVHRGLILDVMRSLGSQMFVTGTVLSEALPARDYTPSVFHVEQGVVQAVV